MKKLIIIIVATLVVLVFICIFVIITVVKKNKKKQQVEQADTAIQQHVQKPVRPVVKPIDLDTIPTTKTNIMEQANQINEAVKKSVQPEPEPKVQEPVKFEVPEEQKII